MKPIEYPSSANPKIPDPSFPFRHSIPLQVRFNDIDMLGHINNSVYLSFLDLGKTHYFNTVVPGAIGVGNISIVVVNINCDFFSPAYISEPLEVLTAVTAVSDRSLTMEQRIVNSDTGDVKCVCHTVLAGFDSAMAQGAPLDPTWVNAISAFEERSFAKG